MPLFESPKSARSGGALSPGQRLLADRRALAIPMLASLVTVLGFAPFAPLEIDPCHDGVMLKPAMDVLSGQVLFRDSMSLYGPLNTYIQAGFLALLGPRLLSLKIGTVAMYGLAAGFLAAAWGRLLPPSLTALSLILWGALAHFYDGSTMYPWASVNALAFQAAALYFLLKSTPAAGVGPLSYPLLCGASAGLCYWCRFNVGLPLIAALGVSYMILAYACGERPWASRRLYAFVAGNVAVHLAFLAVIVSTGSATDWIYQNHTWHSRNFVSSIPSALWKLLQFMLIPPAFRFSFWSGAVRALSPLVIVLMSIAVLAIGFTATLQAGATEAGTGRGEAPSRWRRVAPAVTLMLLALMALVVVLCQPPRDFQHRFAPRESWYFTIPYAILAATAAITIRCIILRARGVDPLVPAPILSGYIASLVALASWTQYFPLGINNYGWWALAPGIGVFAFWMLRLAGNRALAVTLALSVMVLPLVFQRATQAVRTLLVPRVTLQNPAVLAGMRLLPKDAAALSPFLAALDGYIAKHPKTALLVDGPNAIYSTLVPDLHNPSNIWFHDRLLPIPRPEEVESRRHEFIRDRRPLLVVSWNIPDPPVQSTARELEAYHKLVQVNRDRKTNMERIIRDDRYQELAVAHVANGYETLVLLGPRD
jgi:hypothetical protein